MSIEVRPSVPQSAGPPMDSVALPAQPGPRLAASGARAVNSDQLFNGAPELLIDHHGVLYRLKHTSLGKLILTK